MNLAGIYHRPMANYCYPIGDGIVEIRIKTAAQDIQKVMLLFGDPYVGYTHPETSQWSWKFEEMSMKYSGQGQTHDYWTLQIKPTWRRLKYVFELVDFHGQRVILGERGFDTKEHVINGSVPGFFLPFVHEVEVLHTPKWVSQTSWYQIFPERFFNGNLENDPLPHGDWGSLPVNNSTFFGGDIAGITSKLDYIANLGFSGIYMTPIFSSPSGHKYDTVDYFSIDPGFGTMEEFKTFIKQAHQRGIRVMLDGVFNHIGSHSPQWLDVLQNQEKSIYKDWFHIHSFPVVEPTGKNTHDRQNLGFDTFAFTYHMPKLNTSHQEVQQFILSVARYWIEETGIDGWRLDVAGEVDHPFWKSFRNVVRSTRSDIFIVGEILNDALPWLEGDEFDSVMNYHLTYHIRDFIALRKTPTHTFAQQVIDLYHMYPSTANEVLFNLVDCHDTARFLTLCQNQPDQAYLGYLLQYALPGTPSVYYGNEIGLEGQGDPDCRRCMIWEEQLWNLNTQNLFKSLNQLKQKYPDLLSKGRLDFLEANNDWLVFTRTLDHQELRFVLHLSPLNQSYSVPLNSLDPWTLLPIDGALPHIFKQFQFLITFSSK